MKIKKTILTIVMLISIMTTFVIPSFAAENYKSFLELERKWQDVDPSTYSGQYRIYSYCHDRHYCVVFDGYDGTLYKNSYGFFLNDNNNWVKDYGPLTGSGGGTNGIFLYALTDIPANFNGIIPSRSKYVPTTIEDKIFLEIFPTLSTITSTTFSTFKDIAITVMSNALLYVPVLLGLTASLIFFAICIFRKFIKRV